MNRFQKAIAVVSAAAVIGFGGFVSTTATAATNDQVADYLTSAVATQLGLTDTTTLHTIVVEAVSYTHLRAHETG
jgi:CRISPR/Cas system endoribonuclease Cas6 (RAMP superfamily)